MRIIYWVITLTFFDQIIKQLIIRYAESGGLITILYNTGITFGLLQGTNNLMIAISCLAIIVLSFAIKKSSYPDTIGLTLIISGILGNMIDRITTGAVIDYISISKFPVFNLADSMIVTGIIILLLLEIPSLRKKLYRSKV